MPPLRILSYNIRFGGGRRVPLLAAVIGSIAPDVVILQEATNPTAVDRLATESGFRHVLRRPGWSVAALSREEPSGHRWHRPLPGRGFLELELAGVALRLVGLHLPAGLSARGERARVLHADAVLKSLGGAADERTVLMGDFNSIGRGDEPRVAGMPFWLRLLLRFDGGIRTEVIDRFLAAGWLDAYRHLHPRDAGFTLPPGSPQVRFDYTMIPAAMANALRTCDPIADAPLVERASDHLPLLTVLDV